MRITERNLEELKSLLDDVESAKDDLEDPVEVWLDTEGEEAEDRVTAREELEGYLLERLADACQAVVDKVGMT